MTELTRWGRSTADLLDSLQDLEAWGVSLIAQTGLQFDLASAGPRPPCAGRDRYALPRRSPSTRRRLRSRSVRRKRGDRAPGARTIGRPSIPGSRSPPVPLEPSSIHRPRSRIAMCLQCVAVGYFFNCDSLIAPDRFATKVSIVVQVAHCRAVLLPPIVSSLAAASLKRCQSHRLVFLSYPWSVDSRAL